ncbi:hypothetical protein [Gimesia panareensis]|uniref:hypothetical protein n=1 Tax=Gimesia panareensis TaxID=2527978 RepID=UPI00118A799B|nr:hypothetical protein [Gimesia panareensis]QDU51296.1 hypothetical protein Pan110_36600 [Gimesia panareensis]
MDFQLFSKLSTRPLASDNTTGEELRFKGRRSAYDHIDFLYDKKLGWFREAKMMVENSLAHLGSLRCDIERIVLVERLFTKPKDRPWFASVETRKGKVLYQTGDDRLNTLFLTRSATRSYLSRFEEVAHGFVYSAPYNHSSMKRSRQGNHYLSILKQQLKSGEQPPSFVWTPVDCHITIYNAFRNSHWFNSCSDEERAYVDAFLKKYKGRCRISNSNSECGC